MAHLILPNGNVVWGYGIEVGGTRLDPSGWTNQYQKEILEALDYGRKPVEILYGAMNLVIEYLGLQEHQYSFHEEKAVLAEREILVNVCMEARLTDEQMVLLKLSDISETAVKSRLISEISG